MSLTSGGTAPNGCSAGGSSRLLGRLGRDRDHLLRGPLVAVAVPQPDGRGQVLDADHDPDEAPRLARVVRRPQLEHHLVLVAEVDPLEQPAFGDAPEVEVVAEPPAQQVLGVQPALDHRRGGPFRGDRDVVVEVPPHVVGEALLAAVGLPGADDLEGVVVDAARHRPGPSSPFAPPRADMKMPPGPQCTVCGRE